MPSEDTARTRRVLLGEISGVHGVRGEVVIRSYTAEPQAIAGYGPLEDETGRASFTLSVRRVTDKGVIAAVAGIGDRTSAEKLRGTKLFVARDRLPAAAANEYYHADLVGLRAVDPAGAEIGAIVAVHNFGAGDLIEIRIRGSRETELVPFTDAAVPEVDIAAGRVTVIRPEMVEGEPRGHPDDD